MSVTDSRSTIRIGVFIPADAQVLDTACVDILGCMSYEYLSLMKDIIPAPILALAPSMQISYISTVQPGQPIPLTSSMRVACTHHLSDAAVQPGQLDIVLVPGPDPATKFKDKTVTDWLAAHATRAETDILCVCTGIYLCGAAGLLKEGRRACGPRGLQDDLKKLYPGVAWVGDDLRWVKDGNFWSSGGITNGNDLVSAYARQSGRIPGPVAEFALVMTETGDRPQRYETGKAAMTLNVVWQVLKALFMGVGRRKAD